MQSLASEGGHGCTHRCTEDVLEDLSVKLKDIVEYVLANLQQYARGGCLSSGVVLAS